MRSSLSIWSLLALAASCGPELPPPPLPPAPPQVTVTLPGQEVVAPRLSFTVTVKGCDRVTRLEVLHLETVIKDAVYTQDDTPVDVLAEDLVGLYPTLGIAPTLSLVVKATCDDGRSNTSLPAPVTFLPVESVAEPVLPAGQQLPDVFIAEGGTSATPTTLLGCSVTTGGTILSRAESNGTLTRTNPIFAFPCSYLAQFTSRHPATQKRWMWEYGKGAVAFDTDLNVTSDVVGDLRALQVGPDGDAVVWNAEDDDGLLRVAHNRITPSSVRWAVNPGGWVLGAPYVLPNGNLRIAVLAQDLQTRQAELRVNEFSYDTGDVLQSTLLLLLDLRFSDPEQSFPTLFSADGSVLYFAYQPGSAAGAPASTVIACDVSSGAPCTGAALKWQSVLLIGLARVLHSYDTGSTLNVTADAHLWFLDRLTGQVKNFQGGAIQSGVQRTFLDVAPGAGKNFFSLSGTESRVPDEWVGTDDPSVGELVRFRMSGATSPSKGMGHAVDDGGQVWLRMGSRIIKPLSMQEYRIFRGANTSLP